MTQALEKNTYDGEAAEVTRNTLAPRVDILETEQELLLYADMPGVKQDQVDVRFDKGELTIHGRRATPQTDVRYARREHEPADFFRSFRISETINAEKIWAELNSGVFTLHLPKVEAAKPRKITVKGS